MAQIVNTMGAKAPVTQGARALAAMVLNQMKDDTYGWSA